MLRLNAAQLRKGGPTKNQIATIKRNPIYIILDNVLDTYNVGAIFRLADAIAADKIFLCGQTQTPPNPKIKKASIDTWKWVSWQRAETAAAAISKIKDKKSNIKIVAVEQDQRSQQFDKVNYELPLALVVGNETYGVSKEVLDMADMIVELPMYGINKSLNVMVSLGIVLYEIISQIN